jgi:chromosomal replication initiation ATPase DnaA
MTPQMQLATADDIIRTVCRFYGLSITEILKKDRRSSIIKCKHICIWLLTQKVPGMSLKGIGCLVGCVDHTTIIHAREKVKGQYYAKHDNDYKTDIKTLLAIL